MFILIKIYYFSSLMSDLNNKNTGNKNKNLLLVTQLFTTLFIYFFVCRTSYVSLVYLHCFYCCFFIYL